MNKGKVVALQRAGLMTVAGCARIARAKHDGSWTFLDECFDLVVPPDLVALLADDAANFDAFPRSVKMQFLFCLKTAKTERRGRSGWTGR